MSEHETVRIDLLLRRWRASAGLSQQEAGELFGVHQGRVSQWEAGINVPQRRATVRIAKALGLSLDTIVAACALSDTEREGSYSSAPPTGGIAPFLLDDGLLPRTPPVRGER